MILARDLARRGFLVERQRPVSFDYDGLHFQDGFRIDLLIDKCVVVEVKSVEQNARVHAKQLLTYLRLLNLQVGLLLNFGSPTAKEGIQRIINRLSPSASPRLRVNRPPS